MHMCITTHICSSLPDLFTTSWSPSHMASASLRLLCSLLYGEHINHTPVHVFPLVCDPCPIILLHLLWVYNLHMRENMWFLAFWPWLTLLKMMFSSSIHLFASDKISFFFVAFFFNLYLFIYILFLNWLTLII
jgi:hypothetical protein